MLKFKYMNQAEAIKEVISQLLEKMTFPAEVVVEKNNLDNLLVSIQSKEGGFLIGQAGANLIALQHLARALVNKRFGQPVQFILDVNDYRRHRLELLQDLAKDMAKQALNRQTSLVLHPMPAYERRIIHLALVDYPNIATQSIGQEPARKIVIKPTEVKDNVGP